MATTSKSNLIQSVNYAINIIEYLFAAEGEASISEISAGTGMYGSTIHRQLATLKERGYIYQDSETQRYGLGLRFYAIGNKVKNNMPIINVIGPAAAEVAKEYHLTAFIAIPDYSSDIRAQQMIVFKKSYSRLISRDEASVGAIGLSHGSATGKCMMSYYPDHLIRQYRETPLVKLTEKTITDWEILLAEFATIRSRGYALDFEEEIEGRTCIAVPVLDSYNHIIAAISLSGPTRNVFENPVNAMANDLTNVAKMLSSKI